MQRNNTHAEQLRLEQLRPGRLDYHELFRSLRSHLPSDPSLAGDDEDNGAIPADTAAAHFAKVYGDSETATDSAVRHGRRCTVAPGVFCAS